jgi:hypothetical protein
MFNKIKNLSFVLSVLVLSFSLGYLAIAWSEPSQSPPDGGTAAPLNVSVSAQAKEGALIVGANSAVETGLIVQHGKVGIGTTDPQAELHVNGNVMASAPTLDAHLATKGYVDDRTGAVIFHFCLSSYNIPVASCPSGYSIWQSTGAVYGAICKDSSGAAVYDRIIPYYTIYQISSPPYGIAWYCIK